ncbi:MAG TPA: S41 family peptidase [Clostridia bacterium]|nr:S41 family peptidase [Clostridia bacterium]
MEKKYTMRQLTIFIAIAVVIAISATAMLLYTVSAFQNRYVISFDTSKVNYQNIVKFNEVRKILTEDYYQAVDQNKLIEGAVGGLADSLKDPYTVYFNKQQMESFMEKSEGSYVGIGVTVNVDTNGLLTVIEPSEGSPAKKVGMKQGDKIVKVGNTDVTALSDENMIISMIKGKENTKVKLTVYRPSEDRYLQFDITRQKIKASNIRSEIMDGDIGYIRLVMFDSQISEYFESDLKKMLDKGIKGLVIDLRDNPGGSYEQVVRVADTLLPEGTIVYTEDRNGKKEYRKSGKSYVSLPLAILTNGNSASASEILAGAVKDYSRGTLVGTKTFGKGLVQALKLLEDGSGLKVTISRYFTPSGVCIQGKGIMPDIEVKVPDEYRNLPVSQIPRDKDTQLKAALDSVKSKIGSD